MRVEMNSKTGGYKKWLSMVKLGIGEGSEISEEGWELLDKTISFRERGDYVEALKYLQESLIIVENEFSEENCWRLLLLHLLARTNHDIYHFEDSKKYYDKALDIIFEIPFNIFADDEGDEEQNIRVTWYFTLRYEKTRLYLDMADLHLNFKEYSKARKYYLLAEEEGNSLLELHENIGIAPESTPILMTLDLLNRIPFGHGKIDAKSL
jgi:tetratricopeptide (TPR) repeat protein